MPMSKMLDFTRVADTRKSEKGRWMIAAALVGILSTFGVSGTQAQVLDEQFIDDLQKDPATTADWDTVATELKLPTDLSLVPVQSLTGSFLPAAASTEVDGADSSATRAIAIGDLNGDGLVDIAFGNAEANRVYFNDGVGVLTFSRGTNVAGGGNSRSAAIADFNGDGHMDLLFAEFGGGQATRINFNNGSGADPVFDSVDFVELGAASLAGDSVATGDVDNDGDIDVVLAGDRFHVLVFKNDGFGNFSDGVSIFDTQAQTDFHARTVMLGDVDGDGDLDVVAARERDPTRIYLNDGSGSFGPAQTAGGASDIDNALPAPDTAALGDVDGDGRLDLIVGNDGSGTVLGGSGRANYLFLNSGNPADIFPTLSFSFTDLANTNDLRLFDLDRDGDLDVVTADYVSGNGNDVPGPNRVYLNDGTGTFPATGSAFTADSNVTKSIGFGDFDADGDIDLVFGNEDANTSGPVNRIIENEGVLSGIDSDQLFATGESLSIGAGLGNGVLLDPSTSASGDTVEGGRVFQYWLSDDGGATWVRAHRDRSVGFPSPVGNTIRWRVELDSPSTLLRPTIGRMLLRSNTAPSFTSTGVTAATQDVLYEYDITTSDSQNDLRDIRETATLPGWLTLTDNDDGTATLSGTPLSADVAGPNDVALEVIDGARRSDAQAFSIVVTNANDAPTVIAPIGDRVFDQNDAVNIDTSLAFEDLDGDTLAYFATGLPPSGSLTLDPATGILSGTLTNDDVFSVPGGVHFIVVTATEVGTVELFSVDDSFSLTVNDVNDAPVVVAPTGNQEFAQNTAVNLVTSAAFDDPDGDTLTYSATGLPASLAIDPASGDVTGTLTNDDVLAGPDYAVVVTAADATSSVDDSFTLRVNNVNDAPTVVASNVDRSFDQDDSANFNISLAFEDIDGDTLTYSDNGTLPDSLTLNTNSGAVTGTLTNDDALVGPDYTVIITANDGNGGTVDDSFTLTVNNVNDAPTVIIPIGDQNIDQGTIVNLDISTAFEDIDGDSLMYSATGLPTSLTLDANTGVVTGTLTNDDVFAGPYSVVITANDGNGGSVDDNFTLTVNNVNDAPTVVTPTADQVLAQGDSVNLNTSVAFEDIDGDTLTYSATGLPASLNLDTNSGIVTGTLTNDDVLASPYSVVVTANDGNGGTVDDNFTLTVDNVNDAPTVVTPPADQTFSQGTVVNLDISTAFEDIDGDTLTYSATGLPASLNLDANTGIVTGTLTNDDVLAGPDYAIVVTADDGNGGTVDGSFTLTVSDTNDAPTVVAPITDQVFAQDDSVNLNTSVAFNDIDGDTLTYSATGLPASLTIGASSGIVSGTLTNDDVFAGPYSVVITANDGNGGSVDDSFTLTVNNINDAPTFTSTPLTAATEGTAYAYTVSVQDIDGNSLVISASALPGWLTLTATGPGTAQLSGTPSGLDIGAVGITLTVNDGTVLVNQSFTITVTSAAEAPVIIITGDANVSVQQGTMYTDQGATASDAQDGDLTAMIVVDNPVDTDTVGTYFVTYSVMDSAGNMSQAQRTVVVTDATPPVITLLGNATVTLTVGALYTDAGATATDDTDGDLTAMIVVVNSVNTSTAGTYTVTYNVSDAEGNAATEVTRTVTVNNPPPPPAPSGGGGGSASLPVLLLLAGLACGRRRRKQLGS